MMIQIDFTVTVSDSDSDSDWQVTVAQKGPFGIK